MNPSLFDIEKEKEFDDLCSTVRGCVLCKRMENSSRILSRASGNLSAEVLFIGEAPGRLGADKSNIPFHGDKAGHNFEDLLNFANIPRDEIFITNAVLCNPKDSEGNNSTPNRKEVENCANFLKQQIDLVNPKIIVTLGATALNALNNIESHDFNLKDFVRTSNKWYNRIIIPFYHPGTRAMIHRSMSNQRSDYQFLSETIRRLGLKKKVLYSKSKSDTMDIVEIITQYIPRISYFALHKIFYLVEYENFKRHGERITNAYIVRQKDGPYCTDLHYTKLKNSLKNVALKNYNGDLYICRDDGSLFDSRHKNNMQKIEEVVKSVVEKYGSYSNGSLKTKVYLTEPMKKILRTEQKQMLNLYNTPISF